MKKLLVLLAFIGAAFATANKAQAQVTNLLSQYALTVDNTETLYLSPTATISGYRKVITIQFLAVEVSGTTGGTAQVQGSLDGTNFFNIGSAYTLTDVASQVTSFTVTDWGCLYLRLKVTGTGTMSTKIYAKYLGRNS